MSVTKADLRAAREGIQKLAQTPEVGFMDRLFYGKQGKSPYQQMTGQRGVEYWNRKMAEAGITPQKFPDPQQFAKAKAAWVEDQGKKLIAENMKKMRQGGMITKEQLTTGGIGLGLGGLIGAAFGGAKGAAIGSVIGGLGLWAMEKFDLTPDFLKGFIKDTSQAAFGKDADPAKIKEAQEKATGLIEPNMDTTEFDKAGNPYTPEKYRNQTVGEKFGTKNQSPVSARPTQTQGDTPKKQTEPAGAETGETTSSTLNTGKSNQMVSQTTPLTPAAKKATGPTPPKPFKKPDHDPFKTPMAEERVLG